MLATQRTEVWSGVTIKHQTSFADLHQWFAWFMPVVCRLVVDDGTELAAELPDTASPVRTGIRLVRGDVGHLRIKSELTCA
jgi:hypothetical protein